VIKRQSSINKIIYENNGQKYFFGRDNLFFKSVNMPKKQRLTNLCKDFKLKKLIKNKFLPLKFFDTKRLCLMSEILCLIKLLTFSWSNSDIVIILYIILND